MKYEYCEDCRHEVVWLATGINAWLVLFKGSLAFLSGSAALVADAAHSAADIIANIITMTSLKISSRPKDKCHPYGHGKVQYFASSLIGLLLIIGGLEILVNALKSIMAGNIEPPKAIALLGAIVSISVNELIYRYQSCVGKELNSPSIMANAWDNRSDAFSSVGVLIGLIGALIGYPVCDALAAICVALVVLKIGLELNWEAIKGLMDSSPDLDELKKIYQAALRIPEVRDVTNLRARSGGENMIVDLECAIDAGLTVSEGDKIKEIIREKVAEEMENLNEEDLHVCLAPYIQQEAREKKKVLSFLGKRFKGWQRPAKREMDVQ
ncbi:MAG: magnetosome biogenesis CDF transporter MamB [Nitrospinae bacterium]|nr:magnetosome biogenesis CDF transporter MamB [Nitrospinota bacterium]